MLLLLDWLLPTHFLAAGINSRSNHSLPARQIGGLACIPVFICAIIIAASIGAVATRLGICLSIAAMLIWITGYLDDRRELSVKTRISVQLIAAIVSLYGLGENFRLFPEFLPHWLEAIAVSIALLASINIANFMDGLDWLTASGIGIPLFLLGIIASVFLQDPTVSVMSFAMSGAIAGFALFNRPPALIFLGDSGSLPLGLITGIVFLLFTEQAGLISALILPLYYIMDSSTTIFLRLRKGENLLKAHSFHAYQIAKRSGKSVLYIAGCIACLNIALGILATIPLIINSTSVNIAALSSAIILTGLLLRHFRQTN